jgi:hypothetical protein
MTTPRSDEEEQLRTTLWVVAASGAVLTIAAPFVLGRPGVLGVAFGASIAVLNLWVLARVVRSLLAGAGLPWVVLGGLKLLALLALVALLLKLEVTTLLPLGFGYAALPLGIVLSQLRGRPPAARQLTSPDIAGRVQRDSRPES